MTEIIAGRHPVIEALKAGRPITKILLSRDAMSGGAIAEILRLSRSGSVPVTYVARQVLDGMSAGDTHQGVIACAAVVKYEGLADLIAVSAAKNEPQLYCVLDGIEDPHNFGAILRTAEAAGVHGVVVRERRAVGLTPAVARAASGAQEYVPVARVANIAQALERLKKDNVWIVGLDLGGGVDYRKVDYRPPTAIVIGGEGKGLSKLVKQRCDSLTCIPMRGRIASLNASVAAAIVMYEAWRQRYGQESAGS